MTPPPLTRALRQPDDPFRDFCQWDYDPVTPPPPGTLQQAAFLAHSLDMAPECARLSEIFGRIRQKWQPFNTVWGVKSTAGQLTWELYFYDYDRAQRRCGIAALQDCLPDLFATDLSSADALPWFMFSVEFDATVLTSGISSVDLYFEAEGGTISAGQSEIWDGKQRIAKNDYRFYHGAAHRMQIEHDLRDLPPLPAPLAPGRYDEEVFVISRKSHSNAVYFSRVTTQDTLCFARETGFHAGLVDALAKDADTMTPYRFDLGIDYLAGPSQGLLRRSAIYGIF